MNQLLFLHLIFGTLASGQFLGPCCFKKTVGGISYTLVNDYTNTDEYGCQSNCVYQKDDAVGSRYCFAKGGQKLECIDEGSKFKRFIDDNTICHNELQEFIQNVATAGNTLEFRLCNGTKGNCLGPECLRIFEDFTCARHVIDTEDLSKCESEIGNQIGVILSVTQTNCNTLGDARTCPKNSWDPNCNCCKYPRYTKPSSCRTECRCKAACDWFAWQRFCSPYTSVCCSCESSTYRTHCASTCSGSAGNEPVVITPIKDCTYCYQKQENMSEDDEKFCKCKCLCRKIMEKTGSNCAFPWNYCSMDYAFCCECKEDGYPDYNYNNVCPAFCKNDTTPQSAKLPAPSQATSCNSK